MNLYESIKLNEAQEICCTPVDECNEIKKEGEYEDIYGEKVDHTEMRRLITALREICDKSEKDGFNFVDKFKKAVNDLTDVCYDIEDFYEHIPSEEKKPVEDSEESKPGSDTIDELKAHLKDLESIINDEGSIDPELLKNKVAEMLNLVGEHKDITGETEELKEETVNFTKEVVDKYHGSQMYSDDLSDEEAINKYIEEHPDLGLSPEDCKVNVYDKPVTVSTSLSKEGTPDVIDDFKGYLSSNNIDIEKVDENVINDYFTERFYNIEDEEDLDRVNADEALIRSMFLDNKEGGE